MTVYVIPSFMFMLNGYFLELLFSRHWFIKSVDDPYQRQCSGALLCLALVSLNYNWLCFLEKQLWWSTWQEPAQPRSLPRSQLAPPASRRLVYITGSTDCLTEYVARWLANLLTGCLAEHVTGWMRGQLADHFPETLAQWLFGLLSDRLY